MRRAGIDRVLAFSFTGSVELWLSLADVLLPGRGAWKTQDDLIMRFRALAAFKSNSISTSPVVIGGRSLNTTTWAQGVAVDSLVAFGTGEYGR